MGGRLVLRTAILFVLYLELCAEHIRAKCSHESNVMMADMARMRYGLVTRITRMTIRKKHLRVLPLFVLWFPIVAAATEDFAFLDLTFQPDSKERCSRDAVTSTITNGNKTMSILLSKPFLELATGAKKSAKAQCSFDVNLAATVVEAKRILVDVRGTEFKTAGARISYQIMLNNRVHRYDFSKGRMMDAQEMPFWRRFEVDLPKGSAKVRVRVNGKAVLTRSKETVSVVIDSFDLCLIEGELKSSCGVVVSPAGN